MPSPNDGRINSVMKLSGRKTVKGGRTSAPMAAKASTQTTNATVPRRAPMHEEIAVRSYERYLARGAVDGHDVEDWLEAEQQLTRA